MRIIGNVIDKFIPVDLGVGYPGYGYPALYAPVYPSFGTCDPNIYLL